jgi:hypothetical protein
MSKQEAVNPELIKTLKIDEETHERLKECGKFGDSFEGFI